MDALSPPQYRRLSRQGQVPPSPASELPPYSRRHTLHQPVPAARREPTEHVFQLSEGKGKPWVTLKLRSSAKSSKSLPTFFEKENINGQLELTAERGDNIQAITAIQLSGRIISGAGSNDTFTFLNQTLPIWSKSLDSPRVPSPSEGASSAKLLGHCVWPLSIPIPRTVELPSGGGDVRSYRLPETFLERYTKVSIQYDLSIIISRGGLRSDNVIKTAFGYVPSSRPEAPSILRQLVYQEKLPLPGPSTDPEGWKTLRPVSARGCMFKTRPVEARCTLSLAKPLCYTRGSVLPCFVTLEGREPAVLDVLSNPGSVVVKLRRRVRFYNQATATRREVSWNESVEDVGTAVWWQPATDSQNNPYTRHLEGEIHLAKDLRPTCEIAHFSISYFVVLCPFKAANYSSDNAALLSEPVEIATMYAKGPRPNAYAPPAYDSASRPGDDLCFNGSFVPHMH
ncbi:hypothetical protein EST38_g8027 [Candolleomyces aberdarensis]|uniref:Arrestin-like N-terminal domain-containing protein n=1 Tax=Candolleomyces aberdarensis TaxID=2316362 RepID=A0A4Q2DH27_9AGAR|nr:hypothetical protein EST38_g8027 [Candolleomyces aberdarensis]